MSDKSEIELDREDEIRVMTTEVVTAFLSNNQMAARDLPVLITDVFDTLRGLGASEETEEESANTGAETVSEAVSEPDPSIEAPSALPADPPVEEKPAPRSEAKVETETDSGRPVPAVPIESSVTDDLIYCLENGKGFKTLKRHLKSSHNMTPDEYRRKWNLPKDYPMVAPNYSRRRSETAKQIGLGRRYDSS